MAKQPSALIFLASPPQPLWKKALAILNGNWPASQTTCPEKCGAAALGWALSWTWASTHLPQDMPEPSLHILAATSALLMGVPRAGVGVANELAT